MKFVIDAQLPSRMAVWLHSAGHDAVHTVNLPEANRTTDQSLIDFVDREERVVVTKDADFVNSHLLRSEPGKLLLISTGNITNRDLEALLATLIPQLIVELQTHSFLELGRTGFTVRG